MKNGGDFPSLKKDSISAVEFYLAQGYREFDINTINGKKRLIERALELVTKLRSQVEADYYLQQISTKLGVGMEALYTEYKKIKHTPPKNSYKKEKDPEISPDSQFFTSVPELIAGYISRYNFLDLFFREYQYTEADLTSIPDTSLLVRLITGNLDPADTERLSIIDLHLEEDHAHANPELIQRAFRDIIRNLHARLLEKEKEYLLDKVDIHSPEYLEIYTQLSQKAKKL